MVATSKDLQAMKKMMKNLMLVAAAAMGFTACQSGLDEITMRPTEPEKVTISIVASEAEESRTAINEDTQSFVWSEGDQIKVIENTTAVDSEAAVIDENGLATFTASFTAAEGTHTYNALYPNSAYASINIDETTIRTITPSVQNATATSFDPKADLLIAKPIEATQAEATPLNMSFKRLVAIGKMTFKNLPTDATIDAVTFTAPNKVIAGRSSFNYTTGQVIEYGYSSYGESSTTIKYAEAIAANNAVFFTCLPCEIVTEETFTVSVVCGDKTYTRTVTIPEGRSLLFTEGDLTTFSVDMADAAVEESFKFEDGAYVIMASNNGVYYALSNVDSGASTKRLKSVTVEYDGSGSFITTDETLVWNIKAVEDGYTIQDTNNKYISWTSGNSSFVGDTSYSCTITPVDGGLYKIGLVTDSNRFLARNATAANEYFAFYGNTQWKELYIVPFVLDTRPSFTISYTIGDTTTELNTNDKYNFDTAGGDIYFDATRENGLTADITATLDEECDWLYLEEEDVDLFYIEASVNNTTEARSANITFSAEGCEDVVVTIHQATDYVAPITVQEFLDAADTSTTYKLTGKITRVVNTTYGNFDLTDATGTVYIYGLLTPDGTAQAQWAAAGLKEGDIITIEGVYSEYNGAAQVKNAIYVTHQAITVDKVAIQFEVAGGSESVNVSLVNSSDAISASCDNTHFGVTVSGNVVTITAPTNDTSEAQNGTVTITAGELSTTVAVSQSRDTGDVTLLTDILNNAFTGVSGTSYTEWSGKSGSESSAVYAGQSAGGNSSIQLRSNNSNSGIVTTTSGGKVRKVVVTWNTNTSNGRTLNIYGSNTAYTSPTDLYDTSTQGTILGTIVYGTSTELEITGDYAYIGLRSNSGAMYLDEIQISWEN